MSLIVHDAPKTFGHTVRPRSSPWGQVDHAKEVAPGIWCVSTPSHGGYLLSAERRAAMPSHLRDIPTFASGNAYEEDCDWSIVALAFPEHFNADSLDYARALIRGYDRELKTYEIGNAYYMALQKAARVIKQTA